MKTIALIILGLTCISAFTQAREVVDSASGWHISQNDGFFKWLTATQLKVFARQEEVLKSRMTDTVSFYLYMNESPNSPQKIEINNAAGLKASKFNAAIPTRFIIHGWKHDYAGELSTVLLNALFMTGKYNVICVDWSEPASKIYTSAVLSVPNVGKQLANFIDFLNTAGGMSLSSLALLGHSLGAHVSGFAGKYVKNGQIAQIIGLDPAMPGFNYDKPNERLSQNDAAYVESIQTCGGLLGFLEPIGKATFYPNGGILQPGCGIDAKGSCRHARSYEYYAEAILKNDFPTVKCESYRNALDKSCGSTYSSIRLGAATNYLNAIGVFYVPVKSNSPYGLES